MHYAEASVYPPVGVIIMHTLYEQNADEVPVAIETATKRAHAALDFVQERLGDQAYLVAGSSPRPTSCCRSAWQRPRRSGGSASATRRSFATSEG